MRNLHCWYCSTSSSVFWKEIAGFNRKESETLTEKGGGKKERKKGMEEYQTNRTHKGHWQRHHQDGEAHEKTCEVRRGYTATRHLPLLFQYSKLCIGGYPASFHVPSIHSNQPCFENYQTKPFHFFLLLNPGE